MKIAVLGTGMVGRAVAVGLADLGLDVVIGTREPERSLARTGAEDFGTWAAMTDQIGVATYAEASREAVLAVNAPTARGTEALMLLWIRLMGPLGAPYFTRKVAR